MGVLCDPAHPALAHFPTAKHSDWQWWTLTKHSKALDLSTYPQIGTIIEAVDNFLKNRRLSYIFEAKCGKGKLVFSSMDLLGEQDARNPEVRQLLSSVLSYMNSPAFNPEGQLEADDLQSFIRKAPAGGAFPWFGFGGGAPRPGAFQGPASSAGIQSNQ